MSKDGELQPQITNVNGSPKYKYFYSNEQAVLSGMDNALKALKK